MNCLLVLTFVCSLNSIRGADLFCYYNCKHCEDKWLKEYKFCGEPPTTVATTTTTLVPPILTTTTPSTAQTEKPTTETDPQTTTTPEQRHLMQNFHWNLNADAEKMEHACYRADYNGTTHYGCEQFEKDVDHYDCKNLIDIVQPNKENDLTNCYICRESGCNHSTMIELSVLAFINAIILKLFV